MDKKIKLDDNMEYAEKAGFTSWQRLEWKSINQNFERPVRF